MKILKILKSIFVTSGFIAFFFGVLISRNIMELPYFDFTVYLPKTLPPLSDIFWNNMVKGVLFKNISILLSYFIPSTFVSFVFYFIFKKGQKEIVKRGQERVEARHLRKIIKKEIGRNYRLELFDQKIPFPYHEENRGVLFLGKAGAGKTQAIYDFLFGDSRKRRGFVDISQSMIIYERKGNDFVYKLYRENQDYLFDPRDLRGIRWNIFNDMLNSAGEIEESMIDFFVKAFQPISDSKNNHFEKQAQVILKAILIKVAHSKNPSNKILIDFLLNNSGLKELKKSLVEDIYVKRYGLAGSVENALTTNSQGEADNQAMSVMATLNHTFKSIIRREFYYEGGDFSVREFLYKIDKQKSRRLFIINTSDTAGAFGTYFSLLFMLIFKIGKSLENSNNRRILLLLDELQSLGADGNFALGRGIIEELVNFLAESRSKGFVPIIATQSLPQLENLIDRKGMRSLFQLLSTKVILQYDEPDGAKFITDFFAENEILKYKETNSEGWEFSQDRLSQSEEEKLKKVVLPIELTTLKPLEAFLKIGNFPISKISVSYQNPLDKVEVLLKKELEFFEAEEKISI